MADLLGEYGELLSPPGVVRFRAAGGRSVYIYTATPVGDSGMCITWVDDNGFLRTADHIYPIYETEAYFKNNVWVKL